MNCSDEQDLVRAMDEPAAADYIRGLLGENDDEELQQAIIEGLAALEGCETFNLERLNMIYDLLK